MHVCMYMCHENVISIIYIYDAMRLLCSLAIKVCYKKFTNFYFPSFHFLTWVKGENCGRGGEVKGFYRQSVSHINFTLLSYNLFFYEHFNFWTRNCIRPKTILFDERREIRLSSGVCFWRFATTNYTAGDRFRV